MKIGLAVAAADALPSAFVVFRDDLCRCIDRCAALGYDGAELALQSIELVAMPHGRRLRQGDATVLLGFVGHDDDAAGPSQAPQSHANGRPVFTAYALTAL